MKIYDDWNTFHEHPEPGTKCMVLMMREMTYEKQKDEDKYVWTLDDPNSMKFKCLGWRHIEEVKDGE